MTAAKSSGTTRFWVTAPSHAKQLAKRFAREELAWCYLGTDLARRERVSRILARARRVSIGEELNRVAHTVQQPFSEWIASIGALQRAPRNWWGSRLASRSPMQTDCFLLVCYAGLVKSWLHRDRAMPGDFLIIVEDPWLRWLLRREFTGDSRVAFPFGGLGHVARDAAYWVARIPLSIGYTLWWSLWSLLLARLLGVKGEGRSECRDRKAVFLYTWIEARCFATSGTFQDPYAGRLEAVLQRYGEITRRLVPVKMPLRLLWRLRAFPAQFIVTPRYLRLSDIARAIWTLFHIDGLSRLSRFQGADYAPLLYRELLREWGDPAFAFYQLTYMAMRRVATRWADTVKLVIYPFENQPWEKLLCMAFRDAAAAVRLSGYQHAPLSSFELNYFPGTAEFAFAPMPDCIVTHGKLSLEVLRGAGYPSERLWDGGAFRHEYLFDAGRVNDAPDRAGVERHRILVALPIVPLHASALLRGLVDLFPTPFLDQRQRLSVEFVVKCHPRTPITMLMSRPRWLPAWFTISEQPLTELFKIAEVYLYAPPTTTRWDAYLAGLPLLKYCDESLDMDAIEIPGHALTMACSRDTLRPVLEVLLTKDYRPSAANRQQVLTHVFSPVDERVWFGLTNGSLPQAVTEAVCRA